ncbi:hypothetical protein FS749_008110, partial [Ceratobasidium sp. UAMH 11750]
MPERPKFLLVILHHPEVTTEAEIIGKDATALLTQAGWESAYHAQSFYNDELIDNPFGQHPLHVLLVHLTGFIHPLTSDNKQACEADDTCE